MALLDRLASLADAGRVAVTTAASGSDGPAGPRPSSVGAWVRRHAPSQRGAGSVVLAKAAWLVSQPDLAPVAEAVLDGQVAPRTALSVLTQYERIRPRLADPASGPLVLDTLVATAATRGAGSLAEAVPELLQRFGVSDARQADRDAAAARVALSWGSDDQDGTTRYELVADAVSRALFEVCRRVAHAANGDTGAFHPLGDDRGAAGRAQTPAGASGQPALQRNRTTKPRPTNPSGASSAGSHQTPLPPGMERPGTQSAGQVPIGVKSVLFVTMTLSDLAGGTGSARTVGPIGHGTALEPGKARRLACDSGIIPVVLGTDGELLDLGRQTRLFTYPQTKALWLRDGNCTYPGCELPPFWCDAHHLLHWADGGASDLDNAALLCGPHHELVHRNELMGAVTPDRSRVEWNLTTGSYPRPGRTHRPKRC
ncbi:MAG: HNH endonuclease signature motif containing protein [Dermatophilaceae bacterium]